jgi:hypothetical protein
MIPNVLINMALLNAGTTGYLEKDGLRIDILQWFLYHDGSLTLHIKTDQYERDGRRTNPIFVEVTNNGCKLDTGTEVVLQLGIRRGNNEDVSSDPGRITLSERKECQPRDAEKTTIINFRP